MKLIYKYTLDIIDYQEIEIPKCAIIRALQTQDGGPKLWVEVDSNQIVEIRRFEIFGTGHIIMEDMGVSREYIGTFQVRDGALVFHVYERTGI
jgi:hypothetical protein